MHFSVGRPCKQTYPKSATSTTSWPSRFWLMCIATPGTRRLNHNISHPRSPTIPPHIPPNFLSIFPSHVTTLVALRRSARGRGLMADQLRSVGFRRWSDVGCGSDQKERAEAAFEEERCGRGSRR